MFLNKAGELSFFPETPENIFYTEPSFAEIKNIYAKTNLLLEPNSWEEAQEARFKMRSLDKDLFYGRVGAELQKGRILELERLSAVVSMVELVLAHFSFFEALSGAAWNERVKNFKSFFKREILREFRTFVSPEGEVDYFKHPKLKMLRKEQLETEMAIRQTLDNLKNSPDYQNALQFEGRDIINDKYTLAVKSDNFSSKLGAIVARSESGRTLYVEPVKIRNLNRDRFEILLKIDSIILKITKEFCDKLASWGDVIDRFEFLVRLFDQLDTRARLALELNLSEPTLSNKPYIKLENFFHPLIENPVKNSARLDEQTRGLVISGPNTGGKTAAIKSIALCCLFAKHGLFVPAAQAEIHLFERVFYFGNDQQNLPQGLSSFAAETKNYAFLLENLGSSNLVVIDEIFNSTSSEEASALAVSLFDQIAKDSSTKIVVSTHHQTLKTLAHSDKSYVSCHVGFNTETSSPTYKLVYGFPGKSMALEVFRELTKENDACSVIYSQAIKRLDNKMLNYEKLLGELAFKEEKLSKLISANENLQKELRNQKESAKAVAKLKINEEVNKTRAQLQKIASQAREVYKEAKSGTIAGKRSLEKKFQNLESKLPLKAEKGQIFQERKPDRSMQKPTKLLPGEKYFCSFINQTVTLKELKKNGQALVSKGAVTLKCPSDTLWLSNVSSSRQVVVTASRHSDVKLEYDCRGMRLSEFQNLVESVVPEILSGSVPFVNFIHGHGSGALKSWLRSYVKASPEIQWDQTESGNDGETRLVGA